MQGVRASLRAPQTIPYGPPTAVLHAYMWGGVGWPQELLAREQTPEPQTTRPTHWG